MAPARSASGASGGGFSMKPEPVSAAQVAVVAMESIAAVRSTVIRLRT
jgi:hypothetical protein